LDTGTENDTPLNKLNKKAPPFFDHGRAEPRFQALLGKMNLAESGVCE